MSGYDAGYKPQDVPLVPTGPPAYPTFPAGYQQQPPALAPERYRREAEEEEEEEEPAETQKAASIPVEHLNVSGHHAARVCNFAHVTMSMSNNALLTSVLQLEFEQCFHEHSSTKTWPQLYRVTGLVYKYTKLVVYHFFVILYGIVFAFLWAIINGITAFIHTWIWNPALKLTLLWVWAIAPLATEPIRAICTPAVDVSARLFRQIRVHATLAGGRWSNTHSEATQA